MLIKHIIIQRIKVFSLLHCQRRGRELYKSRISTETQFTAKTTIKESCGPQIQEMTAAIEHQVHAGKKYLRLCMHEINNRKENV